jgi:arsenate reductase
MGTGATARPGTSPMIPLRSGREKRIRIAYVCLGNSCRSQMAEAWTRHLSNGRVEAVSAGLHPLGFVARETIQVMEEKQISLAGHRSKGLDDIDWQLVDVLVNMSPMATASVAPAFQGRREEWKVKDPFEESLATYRKVRDELQRRVQELLKELKGPSGGTVAPPVA